MTSARQMISQEEFPGVRFHESLARHTSWHVGGPADIYFTPHSVAELSLFLQKLPQDVPVHWLGLGSNSLIRDGGVRGAVISLHLGLSRLERLSATGVYADAGVPCAQVARQCSKWQIGPAEFFAGIPGTVGGALAMNAGAWGGETWPHVVEVDVMHRSGEIRTRSSSEYRWGYRHVEAPAADEWFLAVRFEFSPQESGSRERIVNLLKQRRETQPIGTWNCGSTFTNPPGQHAARLIESAGLKGHRIGGAIVSEKHANFIINEGSATASDIESLIDYVRAAVEQTHGVRLTTEVRILGELA